MTVHVLESLQAAEGQVVTLSTELLAAKKEIGQLRSQLDEQAGEHTRAITMRDAAARSDLDASESALAQLRAVALKRDADIAASVLVFSF